MVIKNDADTRNEAWAKDKSSFGHRMLAKMGWEEGKGLGKNKQGTVNNLRAVRRAESLGIGATTDLHGDEGFHVTKNNFLGVLERLKQEHDTGKDDKKKKKQKRKVTKDGEGITLAQNRVNAGHARKMRESKDLSKKSKEDMAAIFGMKVDAYTATSSVWGKLKQAQSSAPSVQEQVKSDDELKKTSMKEDARIISTDPSPVSSDTDIKQQKEQQKKLKKESKKKKKKSKKSDKLNECLVDKKTKEKKDKKKKKRKLKHESLDDGESNKKRKNAKDE